MKPTTFYLVLAAKRRTWGMRRPDGTYPVETVKAARVTANPPAIGRDEVAVRLTVDIPPEAFDPLVPDVVVALGLRDVVVGVDVEPPASDEAGA